MTDSTAPVDVTARAPDEVDLTAIPIAIPGASTATIEIVCQIKDDFYRNQYITWMYEKLSERLAAVTGGNANWFTFARWSSFTVGENLRLDKPSQSFDEMISRNPVFRMFHDPITRVQHDLRGLNDAAMPRILAIGNHLVFHEIAYAVAAFLDWYEASPTPDLAAWKVYREGILAARPSDVFQPCDIGWLRDGIEAYFLAAKETDSAKQSRLVLRGSIMLAAYEQWRLQPIVQIALDPVAKHLVEFKHTDLHENAGEAHAILRNKGTPYALDHRSPVTQWFADTYASWLTRFVMAWEGPVRGVKGALFLGRGIPDAAPGELLYPAALDDLTDPNLLIVSVFDHSFGTRKGRGAHNWARFNDRMNFIVNMFRAEQMEHALFNKSTAPEMRILDLDLTDANLDGLRTIGDEEVDTALKAHLGDDGDPREFVHGLIRDEFPTDDDVYGNGDLPPWADPALLKTGQDFLREHGLQIGSALFFGSLPMSYSAARGARVLTRTAELTTGHTTRRLAETGQMLADLMVVDASKTPLSKGTRGHSAARGVRLFHAAVRHMILGDPNVEWDQAEFGVPINQEDLLGTLVVFTVVVVDALEKLGVDFSEQGAGAACDAYIHFWLVVGHLLGIDYDLLRRGDRASTEPPLTLDELRVVQISIFRRQAEPSLGGQTLTAALLAALEHRMPRWLKGYPAAAMRGVLGKEYADALAVPPAGPARVAFDAVRVATRLFSPRAPGRGLSKLAEYSTKRMYQAWIDENGGNYPPWRMEAIQQWNLTPPPPRPTPQPLSTG